jgi:hypothetical protein
MESGYVLDFSNRTFKELILENVGIDIYQNQFDYESGSKANRLRAFWNKESNEVVGKLLLNMLEYWKLCRTLNNQFITLPEQSLFDDCKLIAKYLLEGESSKKGFSQEQGDIKKEQENNRQQQLQKLLSMFDELAKSNDHQNRGFLLQDLLNQLFIIIKVHAF